MNSIKNLFIFKNYTGEKSKEDESLFADFNNILFENIKMKNR